MDTTVVSHIPFLRIQRWRDGSSASDISTSSRSKEGNVSTMTDGRVKAVERVGFVWDSHSVLAWQERLKDLQQ
jgi:hypothetical protein